MIVTTIILAAGQGTRMRSALPKVLHPLGGRPLIDYSLRLAAEISTETPVVVVGHGSERVRQVVGAGARFAVQQPQLGTAHAVQSAETLLAGQADLVMVISADMPLLTAETLKRLLEAQKQNSGPASILTMELDDSHGFGRIVRAADGSVQAIVEEAQASPQQMAIRELNVGAYCFAAGWLWSALRRVPVSPKGEYYITDLVGIAIADGLAVQALRVGDADEAIGINTRVHLAEAEGILHRRINAGWMNFGVTMIDPASTYIEPDVRLGRDTIIYPNTCLRGTTVIGENCVLGPNTVITNSWVGNGCQILFSVLSEGRVDDGARIGPFESVEKGTQ